MRRASFRAVSCTLCLATAAATVLAQTTRTIEFSGRTWTVKASSAPVGPGPNYFSDDPQDVWVDASGRLHLRIAYRDGLWRCSEVITADPLGYGTYTFTLGSRVDQLDAQVVLGLSSTPPGSARGSTWSCSRPGRSRTCSA